MGYVCEGSYEFSFMWREFKIVHLHVYFTKRMHITLDSHLALGCTLFKVDNKQLGLNCLWRIR